jgi:hypothetical protein
MPLTLADFIPVSQKKMADASIYLRKNLVPRQVLLKHPKLADPLEREAALVQKETRALFAAAAQDTLNDLFSTEPSIVCYTYNKGRAQRIKLL